MSAMQTNLIGVWYRFFRYERSKSPSVEAGVTPCRAGIEVTDPSVQAFKTILKGAVLAAKNPI